MNLRMLLYRRKYLWVTVVQKTKTRRRNKLKRKSSNAIEYFRRTVNSTQLLDLGSAVALGSLGSRQESLSQDGRYLAFASTDFTLAADCSTTVAETAYLMNVASGGFKCLFKTNGLATPVASVNVGPLDTNGQSSIIGVNYEFGKDSVLTTVDNQTGISTSFDLPLASRSTITHVRPLGRSSDGTRILVAADYESVTASPSFEGTRLVAIAAQTGTSVFVDAKLDGTLADTPQFYPPSGSISADGSSVAFSLSAANLTAADTSWFSDVYSRGLREATTAPDATDRPIEKPAPMPTPTPTATPDPNLTPTSNPKSKLAVVPTASSSRSRLRKTLRFTVFVDGPTDATATLRLKAGRRTVALSTAKLLIANQVVTLKASRKHKRFLQSRTGKRAKYTLAVSTPGMQSVTLRLR